MCLLISVFYTNSDHFCYHCRMKTLLTISILVFTVMFSSTSFGGWTKLGQVSRFTFYVDFERIRKVDGFVYYWWLYDLLKPDKDGSLSSLNYIQGDCKLFRYKYLSIKKTKEPMGGGTGETFTYNDNDWRYPNPNTVNETILKTVCSR